MDIRTVNRRVLEALIKSGGCDAFKETRSTLFAQIDRTLKAARGGHHSRPSARAKFNVRGMLEDKTLDAKPEDHSQTV